MHARLHLRPLQRVSETVLHYRLQHMLACKQLIYPIEQCRPRRIISSVSIGLFSNAGDTPATDEYLSSSGTVHDCTENIACRSSVAEHYGTLSNVLSTDQKPTTMQVTEWKLYVDNPGWRVLLTVGLYRLFSVIKS